MKSRLVVFTWRPRLILEVGLLVIRLGGGMRYPSVVVTFVAFKFDNHLFFV